jgi:hypothetical protein
MDKHLQSNHGNESFIPQIESISVPKTYEKPKNIEIQRELTNYRAEESIDTIREKIEQQAVSQDLSHFEKQIEQPLPVDHYITKHMKAELYEDTLVRVRKHLTYTQQRFSKFIHQPTIEAVSEISAKSIARPSGLLGGSLVALIGSLTIVIIARHIGFVVPNSIIIILFLIGFGVGIIIEFIMHYHPARIKKRRGL